MKIPLIWLQDYVKTDKSPASIAASFTQLGLMLDKPLGDGQVLDLEHRMDRSDWLSLIGCARDLAAFENLPLTLPKTYNKAGKVAGSSDIIPIKVECPDLVRRFNTRVFRGVKVGDSPLWLRDRLEAYGIKSINNIVDITNFVMVEYGQPMHAQDLAKLPSPEITIRRATSNEKIKSFLGTELTLDDSMFVLTSGGTPVVVGGIVGGATTGVSESTRDFILDAGNYDQRNIRHSSRKLKIANETVLRYDKFLDPRLTESALARATELILEYAGGTYYENVDWYPVPAQSKSLTIRQSRLSLLSGMDLSLKDSKKILTKLGYIVTDENEAELTLELPHFRTDIEVEDDIIADILRIGDYAKIPSALVSTPIPVDITPPLYLFEDKLRDIMCATGCHEHVTGSLVPIGNEVGRINLQNALTSEQSALRLSIQETLMQVVNNYRKHGQQNTIVFEIGKVFQVVGSGKSFDDYQENRHLTIMGSNHEHRRDVLATILHELGIRYLITKSASDITILSGTTVIGLVTPSSITLFTDKLLGLAQVHSTVISEFVHNQSLDLSFNKPADLSFGEISTVIHHASPSLLSLRVLENLPTTLLVRLTWADGTNIEAEKAQLTSELAAIHVQSRSIIK